MAISVQELRRWMCDKCKLQIHDGKPGIEFYQRDKTNGKHIIILHYDCLDKLIAKAKKKSDAPESQDSVTKPQEQTIQA